MSTEEAIRQILRHITGEEPNRDGLRETPARVLRSYGELFAGYAMDPAKILEKTFDGSGYDEMILLKNVDVFSTCEHHLLPFVGHAHLAYIPEERVVGISKLARVVECFSRRLQIQERLTEQIADAIEEYLDPKGVAVVIEAQHFCMKLRGVNKQNCSMVTSALRGVFLKKSVARAEVMSLLK